MRLGGYYWGMVMFAETPAEVNQLERLFAKLSEHEVLQQHYSTHAVYSEPPKIDDKGIYGLDTREYLAMLELIL